MYFYLYFVFYFSHSLFNTLQELACPERWLPVIKCWYPLSFLTDVSVSVNIPGDVILWIYKISRKLWPRFRRQWDLNSSEIFTWSIYGVSTVTTIMVTMIIIMWKPSEPLCDQALVLPSAFFFPPFILTSSFYRLYISPGSEFSAEWGHLCQYDVCFYFSNMSNVVLSALFITAIHCCFSLFRHFD